MEHESENSKLSLKVVVALSSFLISMDFLEIYFSFGQLKAARIKYEEDVFENCIQFNILSQIVFTFFAALAGVSALLLGSGLLYDSDYFAEKLSKSYLYFNYIIFGPYLLAATIFGMMYFNNVVFTCDHTMTNQYFNFSNLMSLVVCFLLSAPITLGYSFFYSIKFVYLSIRFKKGGFRPLGKFFWYYVMRSNDNQETNQIAEDNHDLNLLDEHIELNNLNRNITIHDVSIISAPRYILNENIVEEEENCQEYDNRSKSINKSIHESDSEYKNDKLCQMLQKIINNETTTDEAKKRAINALNLRKKLLVK
jgi:hypothetical protein